MQVFYLNEIRPGFNYLDTVESHHCSRVLRLKTGSSILVIDGKGNMGEGKISDPDPEKCIVKVHKVHNNYHKRPYQLHIAIAPTKNTDRFKWFLEKTTEIGIDEITPLLCERSERKIIKTKRLEKIILSAMKQSLTAFRPVLHEMTSLRKFLEFVPSRNTYIAHSENYDQIHLKSLISPVKDYIIMIGPEGGFSPEEVQLANNKGVISVSLGQNRLRTETAGLVACNIASLVNAKG